MRVSVEISGTTAGTAWSYMMDPSFKPSDDVSPMVNASSLSGYSRTALNAAAGGVSGPDSIKALSESSIKSYLNAASQTLADSLTVDQRNSTTDAVYGGRKIRQISPHYESPAPQDLFPLKYTASTLVKADTLPDGNPNAILNTSIFSTITIEVSPLGSYFMVTMPMARLRGQKIALDVTGGKAELFLDETSLGSTPLASWDNSVSVNISVTHPHPNQEDDDHERKTYLRGGRYVIAYGFNPSKYLLQKRTEKLMYYINQGYSSNSREIVTENLNVIGLSWMLQTELVSRAMARCSNIVQIVYHRFGRVAQENSFYIDIGLQYVALEDRLSNQSDTDWSACSDAEVFVWSALEHGVLAQLQNATASISTMKLISMNNGSNAETYLATNANWQFGTNVRSHLTGYSASDLNILDNALSIFSPTVYALVPKKGNQALNQWKGAGYVIRYVDASVTQMLISGNLNGGYSTELAQVDSTVPTTLHFSDPVVVAPIAAASKVTGGDPVNLATGFFSYESPIKLLVDNRPLPRGLSFSMSYDGVRAANKDPGIGYGWDFNLNAKLTKRSDAEMALGNGTPEQVAASTLGARIMFDLCKNLNTAKDWTVTALVAKWMVDSLYNNATSLTLNGAAYQFPKKPDGTFGHPKGSTLTQLSATEVQERNGNTYVFNSSGKLTSVRDLWGKTATLTYGGSSGHLSQIKDAYNRVFNINLDVLSGGVLVGASITDPQSTPPRGLTTYISGGRHLGGLGYAGNSVLTFNTIGAFDGRIQSVMLNNGPTPSPSVVNTFDSSGKVTEQLMQGDSLRKWQYRYSPGLTEVTSPSGAVTAYYFDDLNRPVARIDPDGHIQTSVFDGQDHVLSMTSATGAVQTYVYDENQNLLCETNRFGQTTQYSYDSLQRLQTITDPRGHMVTYTYNSHHQITKTSQTVDGQVIEINNTYNDANGNLLSTTDPDGNITTFSYDALDRVQSKTSPDGGVTTYTYNAMGDVESVTDARGGIVTTSHDRNRNPSWTLQSATNVDGTNREIAALTNYDDLNRLYYSYQSRDYGVGGIGVTHAYDTTGNHVSSVYDGETSPFVTKTYNTRDLLEKASNQLGAEATALYDANERPVSMRDPLNHESLASFDPEGRPLTSTDPLAHVSSSSYDDANRTVTTTDAAGNARTIHFDENGNTDRLTNSLGKSWTTIYDALNRPTQTTSPEGRITAQTWTKRSQLSTVTLPSGKQAAFAYDAVGRPITETGPGYSSTRSYDPNGNLLDISETTGVNAGGQITRTYDEVNRVTSCTSASGVLKYLWDEARNLTRLTYPDGKTVSYTYDHRNRLIQVVDWANRVTTFTWDGANRLTKLTRPNGTSRSLTYDLANRLLEIEERLVNNRLITVENLSYDDANRLNSRKVAPLPGPWADVANTATYDGDNRLLTFNGAPISSDGDGNLLAAPIPNGPWGATGASYSSDGAFIWDGRNRLTSATRSDTGQTRGFRYDAEGRLIELISGTQSTRLTVNPHGAALSQVLVREELPTHAKTFCVYGLGLLYEERPDGTVRYYHYDQMGSTVALTDDQQRITARAFYGAYGELIRPVGEMLSTPFLFNGRYGVITDKVTGLAQMRARFYNPRLKRFLNADPSGFAGGWNAFAFANGNPVSLADPFGLGAGAGNEGGFWQYDWNSLLPTEKTTEQQRLGGYDLAASGEGGAIQDRLAAAQIDKHFQEASDVIDLALTVASLGEGFLARASVSEASALATARSEARGGTYILRDQSTGNVMRTGRTNDFARREAEHFQDPVTRPYQFEPVHFTDVYEEQRGLEHLLHEAYNPPLNMIRPISPSNQRRAEYLEAARQFLKSKQH